jgi:hypothetical protein
MIDEKHMNAIRDGRAKLRELKLVFDKIWCTTQEDILLLSERHWWTEIEDDMSETVIALEDIEQSIIDALEKIAEITGEDETQPEPRYAPLPVKLPTKEQVFAQRRTQAAAIRRSREEA